jgi:parallel beta-helix repeat protein
VNTRLGLTAGLVAVIALGLIVTEPAVAQFSGNLHTDLSVTIASDGAVEGTGNIRRDGNLYTLTGNIDASRDAGIINAGIRVLKNDIVIDGAGYSITAFGYIQKGVDLDGRKNVTIKNLNINGFVHGISLIGASNNIIQNSSLIGTGADGFQVGFWIDNAHNNCIEQNSIAGFDEYGMLFQVSSNNNIIVGNTFADNKIDIALDYSGNNEFKNNQLNSKNSNLKVSYNSYSDFVQNIDTSNKIRGKPIYYWLDEQDKAVPLDAGFVALGNCKNIIIQNLNISSNSAAIIMYSTSNSLVSENFLANNGLGISLYDCLNLSLTKNVVVDGSAGITVRSSSNISISQNYLSGIYFGGYEAFGISLYSSNSCFVMANNVTGFGRFGIQLSSSTQNVLANNYLARNAIGTYIYMGGQNTIFQNSFVENKRWGMQLSSSRTQPNNNLIYYNNFINNTSIEAGTQCNLQVSNPWYFGPETNIWDNGTVGNYWSDYTARYTNASEIGNSGIGNTFFEVNENNIDHYPLMKPVPFPQTPNSSDLESFPSASPSFTPNIPSTPSQPLESPTISLKPSSSQALTLSPTIPEFTMLIVPVLLVVVSMILVIFRRKVSRQ